MMTTDGLPHQVRLATMKRVPTDVEVGAAGVADGGELVLALRRSGEYRSWCMERQQAWNTTLEQPIWQAVHHLITIMIRTVEDDVLAAGAPSTGKRLSRRQIEVFRSRRSARFA